MFFSKKVAAIGGFSVFFLDICHTNVKLPTFNMNFKDEKQTNDSRPTCLFCPNGLWTRKEIRPLQCSFLQHGEFIRHNP